jgi:hypothetical protein
MAAAAASQAVPPEAADRVAARATFPGSAAAVADRAVAAVASAASAVATPRDRVVKSVDATKTCSLADGAMAKAGPIG